MRLITVVTAMGLAAAIAGCENKTTTTGSTVPSSTPGKPAVKRLTVKAAPTQTIKQGDTDEVSIKIDRDNFNDPVTIRLNELPKGITCEPQVVIPANSSSGTFTLKAAPDAEVGEFEVKID